MPLVSTNGGCVVRKGKQSTNKPSNAVVSEAGPVMGGSWPALSDSTKGAAKLAAESSSNTALDTLLSTYHVSVTKELIRGVSNRLAGPKLSKTFEIGGHRVDSAFLRIDSFLGRNPSSNIKSIHLWIESTLEEEL
ncbi:hypothetical protein PIB30_085396 [Stylosanthes scabra]|uniref:Uncharacterized protein n=1 Tax=Stylosanthes scabra TaxID=79078 RepID=A0ABU6XTY0_9FABA|nr:hypothetical protein [Stylosanthes scabra]